MAFVKLEVIQSNLQHCKEATAVICRLLDKLHTGLALVQEPWVFRNQIRGLSNRGGTLYWDRTCPRPRTCIYVKQGLDVTPLPRFISQDIVAVKAKLVRQGAVKEVIFASVYLPYDSEEPPPSRLMVELVQYCQTHRLPLLVGCDANAHHTVWGSTDINARGRLLLEYLATTDLDILNKGNEATFVNAIRREVLDLTLGSTCIAHEVKNWRVSLEESLSDHRHIRFQLCIDPPQPSYWRNPRNTNWDSYRQSLGCKVRGRIAAVKSVDDVENEVRTIEEAITSSYEYACPLRKKKPKKGSIWWNQNLARLRTETNKNYQKARRHEWSEDTREDYKDSRKEYKKALRRAKRETWRRFCESVDQPHSAARLHKLLSKDPSTSPEVLQLPNGEFTTTQEETLNHLLDVHFPGNVDRPREQVNLEPSVASDADWEIAAKIVTKERVSWAVKSFSPYKAAGEDGIFPALLQEGLEYLLDPLVSIFKASVALGYTPMSWRAVRVVFIPKPGKNTYYEAKSFRPISLTSFLLKTVERLVDRYLREEVLTRQPLHKNQHAYQAGKSTESALHCLVSRIERALNRKQFALGAFLDIQGAFDNTAFQSIETALQQRNTAPTVVAWISSMLRHRLVHATVKGTEKVVLAQRGCPQGGVLSPLLWNLVIDSLLQRLNSMAMFTQAFADDGTVLIEGIFLPTVCEVMQTALNHIQQWCEEHGLTAHPKKTELVLFTHRRKIVNFVAPKLGGEELKLSSSVKYLGVILDSKLSWSSHVESKYQKSVACLWQCRRIVGKSWGISPKIAHWLYVAIIRPMFSYAAIIWWKRVELETTKTLLCRLQRLACLCVTGAMRTTPTAALEVLLGLPTLDLHVKKEAMAACHRLRRSGTWVQKGSASDHSSIQRVVAEIPVLNMPCDGIIPQYLFGHMYSVHIPKREDWNTERDAILPPETKSCFTDGSKMDGKAGAGVHFADQNTADMSLPLGHHATVFQAEVHAIAECAQQLQHCHDSSITICSDSQAALKALQSPKVSSLVVRNCKQELARITESNKVSLVWVPGHSGIEGNEIADQLAREASQTRTFGPEPMLPVSQQACKTALRDWCQNKTLASWLAHPACRQAKELIGRPKARNSRVLLKLPRKQLRLVVGVLTGHCTLNRHLHIMGIADDPTCRLCGEGDETSRHFLGECAALAALRQSTLGQAFLKHTDIQKLTTEQIRGFVRSSQRFDY